ncbi:MAG: ABC transporter ATP-binding protein [Myxococcaceae bacterium]|nr:ABC transporter ATP-binding protein [Myxococcaceae bacterium]
MPVSATEITRRAPEPSSEEPVIRFVELWKSFGPKKIYEGLNLDVKKGETLTIIGGSGSGKSVLLKCLIGLMYPDQGQVLLHEENVAQMNEKQLREVRKRVSMVFQGAALFDSLSVGENIAYPLNEHLKLSHDELTERVARVLKLVNLPGVEHMRPSDLSGGMRKRVGLARAIAIEPEIILYDEPSTGLDPISTRVIDELILSMKEKLGCTQIVVTHDMDSAFRVSDRMAMLAHRKIVAQGTVAEFKASTHPDVRAFLDARAS